jgi:hypothetical protein
MEYGWSWVPYQLVAELNGGVMVAPLLPLAAAAEHADPLEPRLPHRHAAGLTTLDRCCRLYIYPAAAAASCAIAS